MTFPQRKSALKRMSYTMSRNSTLPKWVFEPGTARYEDLITWHLRVNNLLDEDFPFSGEWEDDEVNLIWHLNALLREFFNVEPEDGTSRYAPIKYGELEKSPRWCPKQHGKYGVPCYVELIAWRYRRHIRFCPMTTKVQTREYTTMN